MSVVLPGPDLILQMYGALLRVRMFEERVRELFAAGRIPGFLHTSIGQEATAVGAASALGREDYVRRTAVMATSWRREERCGA